MSILSNKFHSTLRRAFSVVTLFVTEAAAPTLILPADTTATPPPPPQDSCIETPPPFTSAITKEMRDLALENAHVLADAHPGPYAQDIKALQQELDDWLDTNGSPFYDRIIVLDPGRIDTLSAMGLPTPLAIADELSRAGYDHIRLGHLAFLTHSLTIQGAAPLEDMIAVNPIALSLADEKTCIIVPAAANGLFYYKGLPLPRPGIDIQTAITYLNEHEGVHCKDSANDFRDIHNPYTTVDFSDKSGILNKPDILADLALIYRLETFADVAAVGKMIRDGHAPALATAIGEMRADMAAEGDILHTSTPAMSALAAMARDVTTQGLRSMDETTATAHYVRLAKNTVLSKPEAMHAYITYRYGSTTERMQLELLSGTDTPERHGIDLLKSTTLRPRQVKTSDQIRALKHAAKNLDAEATQQTLETKARQDGGAVTPATLLIAYNALQQNLRQQMHDRPYDLQAPVEAMHLRTVFRGVLNPPQEKTPARPQAPRCIQASHGR